ncbi:MAG: hypothetical protein QOE58_3007, partial [Actinomycetota bacterium]|nr:hypothetical protein [Actinomycetota bacterium]
PFGTPQELQKALNLTPHPQITPAKGTHTLTTPQSDLLPPTTTFLANLGVLPTLTPRI